MKRLRILSKTFQSGELGIGFIILHIIVAFLMYTDNQTMQAPELILYLFLSSLNPFVLILEGRYYLDIIFLPEREISGKIVVLEDGYNLLKKKFGTKCDRYVIWNEEAGNEITLYCYHRVYDFFKVVFAQNRNAAPNYIKCRYLRFTKLITAVEYVEYPEVLIKKRRKRKKADYRRIEREET